MLAPGLRRHLAAVAVATTLPGWAVLRPALAARAADYAQFSDQAVLEMQVLHATRAIHLLGPYSRYHFNHPGPLFFYLMAPLYALSGHASRSVWLSVWLLQMASQAGVVMVVGRIAGRIETVLVALLLAWQTLCIGPENLCDPWGPYVVVLPFELLAFVSVALAVGSARLLPLAVFLGSFVVQTDIATFPAASALLATGVACGVGREWFDRSGTMAAPKTWRRAWLSAGFVALAVAGALWWPAVVEELGGKPGNLTKLRGFADDQGRSDLGAAVSAMAEHVTAVLGLDPGYRLHASESAVHAASRTAMVAASALFALVPLAGLAAWRKGRAFSASGALVVSGGVAGLLLSGTRATGPLMSYLFMWTAGIGTLAAAVVLAEVLHRAADGVLPFMALGFRERLDKGVLVGVFAAATVAAFHSRSEILPTPYFYGRPRSEVRGLSDAVEHYLHDERLSNPVARVGTEPAWGMMAGVLLELYKDGVPFSVEEAWQFMFGAHFRPRRPADVFLVFGDARYEELARDVPGCALLAQSSDTYIFGSPVADAASQDAFDDPCP